MTLAQIDTHVIQAVLDGFVIHERVTARAAIDQLMQAFFFTIKESAAKLVLIPRDTSVDATITASQCIPIKQNDQEIAYTLTRKEDLMLPEQLEVQFLNRLQSYETNIQRSIRSTQDATDTVTLRLSLVLSETHARSVAESQLTDRWAERSTLSLQLPIQYATLEPGDVLELVDGESTQRIRLSKVQIGRPGIVKVSGAIDASDVWDGYISPVEGSDGKSVTPNPATRFEVLDIPALPSDAQDALTLRFAACGVAEGWTGATITRLLENGEDRRLTDISSPATIGSAVTALAGGPSTVFDVVNTVDVALVGMQTLAGTTEINLSQWC